MHEFPRKGALMNTRETYREQLDRWVAAMTVPNEEQQVSSDLAESDADRVKMFVDGNLEKRLDKIERGVEIVASAFDEEAFLQLMMQFIGGSKMPVYDTGAGDAERFLIWLEETQSLSAEQRDRVVCQRTRHEIEEIARSNRMGHIRFQEMFSLADSLGPQFSGDDNLQIHVNPVRTSTQFHSDALLGDGAMLPADVLFFATRSDISTAVLEDEGADMFAELCRFAPCTLSQWAALSQHASREQLEEFATDLTTMGLAAIG